LWYHGRWNTSHSDLDHMKRSLFVIAMACLAAALPVRSSAHDGVTADPNKQGREQWQSRVNANRERLEQLREELRLEREKRLAPKREELRLDREKRIERKQEELRLDREKRLGTKQEELRLDREKRLGPKQEEIKQDRENRIEPKREQLKREIEKQDDLRQGVR
jgi:hypothetical protein